MKVEQIHDIVNTMAQEATGQTENLVQEDLSDIVQVGETIINALGYDNYVRRLVDKISKVTFVDRPYSGFSPSVRRDGSEWAAIWQKVRAELPEAESNPTWLLEDRESYDQNVFYKPQVSDKFFSGGDSYQIPRSHVDKQIKSAFRSADELNGFFSMIETAVRDRITINTDKLTMATIAAMIGETVYSEYAATSLSAKSGVRAVNLLYMYNNRYSTTLTKDKVSSDPDFIRFASYVIGTYIDDMRAMSVLFNMEGQPRFTPKERMHIVMLSEFKRGMEIFLQSSTYHKELVSFPAGIETVPYWQGYTGLPTFERKSGINLITPSNKDSSFGGHSVSMDGILAVLFDHEALGVNNERRNTTSHHNDLAEFTSYWHKVYAEYFIDSAENFVVFFAA